MARSASTSPLETRASSCRSRALSDEPTGVTATADLDTLQSILGAPGSVGSCSHTAITNIAFDSTTVPLWFRTCASLDLTRGNFVRLPGGGRMSLKALGQRLYREYENDAVADSAAALGYYFVFALFPFMFFLTTLAAYIPYVRRSVDTLLARGHEILPPQAMALIDEHLRDLVAKPRPRLLTV